MQCQLVNVADEDQRTVETEDAQESWPGAGAQAGQKLYRAGDGFYVISAASDFDGLALTDEEARQWLEANAAALAELDPGADADELLASLTRPLVADFQADVDGDPGDIEDTAAGGEPGQDLAAAESPAGPSDEDDL